MPDWPYLASEPNDVPAPILYQEPLELTAGDTLHFFKTLGDYKPSDGWALLYSLRGVPASAANWTSTTSGDSHEVTVTAAATSIYLPGIYTIHGYAVKASTGERHRIYRGTLTVMPDLQAAGGDEDFRTAARIAFDNIWLTIQGRATDDILDSSIAGTTIRRLSAQELWMHHDRLRIIVDAEDGQARAAQGRDTGRAVYARFRRPL